MTAPDTNTPRDGLTDAEILALHKNLVDRNFPVSVADFKEYVRVIQREIRAADREARPAPASVEVLRVEAKRLAREVRIKLTNQCVNPSQKNVRACDAADAALADCIDRLAAASTPPAAPPKDHEVAALVNSLRDIAVEFHAFQSLREKIKGVVLPFVERCRAPANEARATGDAALRSAAQEALNTFQTICNYCDSSDIGPTVAEEIESTCDSLRAAITSALAAPPVAPAGYEANVLWWAESCDQTGVPSTVGAMLREYAARLAATGAAGEPQPREVNK